MLRTIEQLEDSVAAFDTRIEAALSPFLDIVERLREVPGLGATATETVIAEIGTDMSPFPTVGHLLSWAGVVPRLDESADKRLCFPFTYRHLDISMSRSGRRRGVHKQWGYI
jgi:transposase